MVAATRPNGITPATYTLVQASRRFRRVNRSNVGFRAFIFVSILLLHLQTSDMGIETSRCFSNEYTYRWIRSNFISSVHKKSKLIQLQCLFFLFFTKSILYRYREMACLATNCARNLIFENLFRFRRTVEKILLFFGKFFCFFSSSSQSQRKDAGFDVVHFDVWNRTLFQRFCNKNVHKVSYETDTNRKRCVNKHFFRISNKPAFG